MIIHVRTAHHRCQAESVAQDTELKHGKHGSGALLSSFLVLLVVVLAEHGGCLPSVDRDRELRIWNEREARRNECETRGCESGTSAELVRTSVRLVAGRRWNELGTRYWSHSKAADCPWFSGREEHFYVWTKKIENYVSGVFPHVRGALAFAAESQDVVTAVTVAIGVPELGVETSAEIDGQLFVVLSALTEGESFDIVMSAGGDHGFESWSKLHGRWNPNTAGRARSLLREILSPTQSKLPELMGAIEKMGDLVRRYSSRRDAQGNAHGLAEDIRMSSLEALLPDDLEKHVQLNRSRLTSCGVLREEIKTYCECGGHTNARNVRQKGSSHPGGDDPMDIGAFWQWQGQTKQSQARQGQRQRKTRTARTGQEQLQEQGFA